MYNIKNEKKNIYEALVENKEGLMNTNIYIFSVLNSVIRRIFILIITITFYMLSNTNIIDSETIQVTTYYPAPYGAYYRFLTTDNTWLARNGGNVAIGLSSAGQKVDIAGGNLRVNGELISTMGGGSAQFRAIAGNYGFMIRNDGPNTWFLLTNPGNQYGGWNSLRPFRVVNNSGDVFLANSNLVIRHSDGAIGGLCRWRPFSSYGWSHCAGNEYPVVLNYTGFAQEDTCIGQGNLATPSGRVQDVCIHGTKTVGVSGSMLCCKFY